MLYDKGAVSYTFTFFADYSADWGCSGGQEKYNRTFLIVIISIAILTLIISLLSVWGIIKLNRKVKIRKEQQTGIVSVIDQTGRHWDTVEL